MQWICPKHGVSQQRKTRAQQRGYSLLEAMVSTTISAILAGAAMPAYEAYVARAQVTEAMGLMASLKPQVLESVYMGEGFPNGQMSLPSSTRLVSEVTVMASEACPELGGFEARMAIGEPHAVIAGKTVRLWYNGNNGWSCTAGDDDSIELRYLPTTCRQPSLTIDTSTCTLALADDADLPDSSDVDEGGDIDDGDDWDDGDSDWEDNDDGGSDSDDDDDGDSDDWGDGDDDDGGDSDDDGGSDGDDDDDGGKITICHKPGTPAEKTLSVAASSWGGHSGHGDTMGACP